MSNEGHAFAGSGGDAGACIGWPVVCRVTQLEWDGRKASFRSGASLDFTTSGRGRSHEFGSGPSTPRPPESLVYCVSKHFYVSNQQAFCDPIGQGIWKWRITTWHWLPIMSLLLDFDFTECARFLSMVWHEYRPVVNFMELAGSLEGNSSLVYDKLRIIVFPMRERVDCFTFKTIKSLRQRDSNYGWRIVNQSQRANNGAINSPLWG